MGREDFFCTGLEAESVMRIALVGFGSVGRSLAEMLPARSEHLYRAMGLAPKLVAVIDSRGAAVSEHGLDLAALDSARKARGTVGALSPHGLMLTGPADAAAVIRDLHADVLVEASPSSLANPLPAMGHMKAAMSSRKHVVSANKAPLALAMPALLELARFNRIELRYSGTVGAGTPVLDTARRLAQGDRITRIRAILNGTTNFILWKMATENAAYDAALAEAQKLGFAETDPSTDVDGIDTATKVVILANAVRAITRFPGAGAAGLSTIADVRVTGIRGIQQSRLTDAASRGQVIKLIGDIDLSADHPVLSVAPQEVPARGPLDTPRSLNAVQYTLESAGEVTLVGRGAGGPETATAIIRDLVDIWNTPGAHD